MKEDKALNHIIHMEERTVDLLKSLKDQNEISEKDYDNLYPVDSKPGNLSGLWRIHKLWRMEFQFFFQFYQH